MRSAFFSISFVNGEVGPAIGAISLPDKNETYRMWDVIPESYSNSEAGLTEFRLINQETGEELSAERTDDSVGGTIFYKYSIILASTALSMQSGKLMMTGGKPMSCF